MTHLSLIALAVALMLSGAAMIVAGSSSVVPFAAITAGIALTLMESRNHPAH